MLGIKPTYPSEKYGYIIPENTEEISYVHKFQEKPDQETAERYIMQGALFALSATNTPCADAQITTSVSPIAKIGMSSSLTI